MEIEELQERYSDLEKKYDSLCRENILLKDTIKQMAISKVKLKIDLVAEMKMAKMLFEMVLSGGHTHREKEMLARMSNNILDLNIDKAEQLIAKGINTDDTLPF